MATYDATTAECLVYSYKDGLLSKIAHDLKHRVTQFALRVDDRMRVIEAELDARSLRVECVMKDGVESDAGLSAGDKEKIEAQIVDDVLNANAHPRIRFASIAIEPCPEGLKIHGMLELNNVSRPVAVLARRVNGHYEADVKVHQPDFGIKPFSAMMGTLKIKPDVLVRMVVPAAG